MRNKRIREGVVEGIEFLAPDEVLLKYGDELFLNKEELYDYMAKQLGKPTKKMLVLSLIKIRKYSKEIKYPGRLTMAGEYLKKNIYP